MQGSITPGRFAGRPVVRQSMPRKSAGGGTSAGAAWPLTRTSPAREGFDLRAPERLAGLSLGLHEVVAEVLDFEAAE
jgi:hypothetical protein